MNFEIYEAVEISRKPNRHGIFDKNFWLDLENDHAGLPSACGCYIFALKVGDNMTPWYVGKTERQTFKQECFQATKKNYYNDILVDHKGIPLLFFIPRVTPSGKKFSKPTKSGYRDIEYLETILIGLALEKNSKLLNIKKTKLLRDMKVPGIINSPQARPTAAVRKLKRMLGL